MKIVVSHPTGNSNVRAVINAFSRHKILAEYRTTIAVNPDSAWLKILPESVRTELLRRKYEIEPNEIHSSPFLEIGRLAFNKLGIHSLTLPEVGKFSIDQIYRSLDISVAKSLEKFSQLEKPDMVYAYEDGAEATFKMAKKLNILSIYDLPIGYWRSERELLGLERAKRPDWAMTLTGFNDSDQKLQRKDNEIQFADRIVVASSFTKSTLSHYPGKLPEVTVIPYGFPKVTENRNYDYTGDRKLKLLFVGGLSQRKGIAEVLEAADFLKENVELTIIGRKSTDNCDPLNSGLKKHRYIPSISHADVLKEMQQHDILLFPSLFEGFGLVVTEAMSQGTPVITTTRTCGADLIAHNEDGWLIEAGSTEALVNQIKLILTSPERIEFAGRAAMIKAHSRPWSQYGTELVEYVEHINANSGL